MEGDRGFGQGLPEHRGRPAETVTGRMAPTALGRAPELFDQSVATILSELFQNGRRAGADTVDVDVVFPDGVPTVRVSDNGRGIADLQEFVSFGRTGWSEGIRAGEDTAGMGTFCLASRGCRVLSLGRGVTLAPEVFVGRASAPVERAETPSAGTEISFPLHRRDGPRSRRDSAAPSGMDLSFLEGALVREALYCPLRIRYEGREVPRLPFLEHALEVHRIRGVDVGVYDAAAWKRRNSDVPGVRYPAHVPPDGGGGGAQVNFGGHLAEAPETGAIHNGREAWRALWDVRENAALRLTLPTRDRVVEDEAWSGLLGETLSLTTRRAAFPGHRIPMSRVIQARAAGAEVPDPGLVLARWTGPSGVGTAAGKRGARRGRPGKEGQPSMDPGDLREEGALRCVLVPGNLGSSARAALMAACRSAGGDLPLAAEDPGLVGLPSYDRLPRVETVEIRVKYAGERARYVRVHGRDAHAGRELGSLELLEEFEELTEEADPAGVVERIEVRATARPLGPRRADRRILGPVEVPVLPLSTTWGEAESFRFVHGAGLTLEQARAAMDDAFAVHSEKLRRSGRHGERPDVFMAELGVQALRWVRGGAEDRILSFLGLIARDIGRMRLADADCPVGEIWIEDTDDGYAVTRIEGKPSFRR